MQEPAPATQRRELEQVDDLICDLYSGQNNGVIRRLDPDTRTAMRGELDEVLAALRAWRTKWDLEWDGEAAQQERPAHGL